MAALIAAALGSGNAPQPKAPTLEMPSTHPSTNPSTTRNPTYFDKVASDIVTAAPIFGKPRVLIIAGHRDKESLVGEIIDLKKALEDTELHLHMHKQHYLRLIEESRKLEREVEELELRGNFDAPRTGGVVRLESRFKGLTSQIEVLEDVVAERKYGELAQLRKDLGSTHTREIEVERDTLAREIARLKIYLNHMKLLHEEAKEENGNLQFCKRQIDRLQLANPKAREFVELQKVKIERARNEIERYKREGEGLVERMKKLANEDKKFDKELDQLEPAAQAARGEVKKVVRQQNQLRYNRMIFNKDFKENHPGVLLA